MSSQAAENSLEYKERLIAAVKKEVKQVMEEAVTRKFVHEESGSVTSLCGAVEACLSQGLRRRALGLFKTSSTTALLHKVAKHCEEAAAISRKVLELDNSDPTRRSSSSGDSTSKPPLSKKNSSTSVTTTSHQSGSQHTVKYLWIRLALFDKQLARIIDHLASNANRYYERDALVADPDYGSILSSLLVGPCALDFSKSKTPDHFWTDPPADELVQRHRISSGHPTPPSCRRPMLNFKRSLNSEEGHSTRGGSSSGPIYCAKDYVESLHQNSRATLLYGKNNVRVLPKDVTSPMAGYLSLHQTAHSLTIKWTPNQLMNGYAESEVQDKSKYWNYALNIVVDEIVYVHCHQGAAVEDGGTLILVGQDGVQRPPIMFPGGGHLAAFLSCLETGLLPHGQLDPPLWSARGSGKTSQSMVCNLPDPVFKVFPRPPRPRRRPLPSVNETNEEQQPSDYVFRIVSKSNHEEFVSRHGLLERENPVRPTSRLSSSSTTGSSESSNKSLSLDTNVPDTPQIIPQNQSASIALVCSTMKRQIISRAFYGWLAYCRHLSTVRTHLSGLVNANITPSDGAEEGLTAARWKELSSSGIVSDCAEVYRLAYWGGVEHEIRKEVWPYLLGHYSFGSTATERTELDEASRQSYETTMSEWLAVEAIVRQRDKEATAASIAKLSSESASDGAPPADVAHDLNASNDVFEDSISDEDATCLNIVNPMHLQNGTFSHPDSPIKHLSVDQISDTMPLTCEQNHDGNEQEESDMKKSEQTDDEVNNITHKCNGDVDTHAEGTDTCLDGKEYFTEHYVNHERHSVFVTNPSVDFIGSTMPVQATNSSEGLMLDSLVEEAATRDGLEPRSNCVSPASSNGGVYSMELLETFGLNLHRIDKDVQRCDRNYWYFSGDNLDKLRNVMCTYVWGHLDTGYMQGMCDLVAPLLVILDDESQTYACFCQLMERMIDNFPNGGAMDTHFANMRSLIQILDSEMFELMHAHGDYTHFYFCYRWFLLDFKRELLYCDVFSTWETIWAARHVASAHLVLFLALALLETYRDIILSNSMDFTDIIKFFNEMAERHNARGVLALARDLVLQLQTLMENK